MHLAETDGVKTHLKWVYTRSGCDLTLSGLILAAFYVISRVNLDGISNSQTSEVSFAHKLFELDAFACIKR